ncbi:MAG: G1 family glutamic endopeptidase, partial [Polyangiaceae bacterium]
VEQSVGSDGATSYSAWFEWYTAFTRTRLGDTTASGVGLAPHTDGITLVLAFRQGNDRLAVMYSTDQGNSFGNKLTTSEQTVHAPSLTQHEGFVMMGWTAKTDGALHIATVTMAGSDLLLGTSATLPWTSPNGPALASLDRVLYVAWVDRANVLNLASSTNAGQTFTGQFASTVTSTEPPALAVFAGKLYVAWKDAGDQLNVGIVNLAGGNATGIRAIVPVTGAKSPRSPALAATGGTLYVAWKEESGDALSFISSKDEGATFDGEVTTTEKSPNAPTLTVYEDKLVAGWRGEDGHVVVAGVGTRVGNVVGLNGPAPYRYSQTVQNLPVKPGDQIVCTIFYADFLTAGTILFGNVTSGQYYSVTLMAPLEADLTGGSVEWIMEAPSIGSVGQQSSIAKFADVTFTDAFGCGPDGAFADPQNGDSILLHDPSNAPLTSVALAPDQVTIQFTG